MEDKDLIQKLNKIKDKMNILTREPKDEFVDDFTVFIRLFSDNYREIDDNFWNYFKTKYELPEIKEHFDDTNVLLSTVFYKCIRPFYLRLDILPGYNIKYEMAAIPNKLKWKIHRFFSNNWITIILTILMIFSFSYSSTIQLENKFEYDVFMSLGTGFLVSLILSTINASHSRKTKKKLKELEKIKYEYNILKNSFERSNNAVKTKIEDKTDFVQEFILINNALNDFINNTKDILSLKTIDTYHRLFDFEKEIFDYSSRIVRKPFKEYSMDLTTDDEIGRLQIYIIQLGDWLSHFEMEIMDLKNYYLKDIDKMNDKSL